MKNQDVEQKEKSVYKENLNKLEGIIGEKEELIIGKHMENFEIEGNLKNKILI